MGFREAKRDICKFLYYLHDGFYLANTLEIGSARSLEKVLDVMETPALANAWNIRHLRYIPDKEEEWKTITETIEDRGGDCDDYAGVNTAGLKFNKVNAKFMTLWGFDGNKERGHATCLVDEGDTFTTVGTFKRINHISKDLREVGEYWYKPLEGICTYDINLNDWSYNREIFFDFSDDGFEIVCPLKEQPLNSFARKMNNIDKGFEQLVEESRIY